MNKTLKVILEIVLALLAVGLVYLIYSSIMEPVNFKKEQKAREAVGKTGVWVYGYIVGGDLSSTGAQVKTQPPFSKKTHLAIASRASATTKSSCIAVELPVGELRNSINISDHPELVGRTIYLKGDIVSPYFATVGLKKVSDWRLP